MTLTSLAIPGRWTLRGALVCALSVMTVASAAESLEDALVKRYPTGSIASVATAKSALAEVDAARREAEQRFGNERMQCFEKFFTSSCLSDAKDVRRMSLSAIRRVEVEANAFIRKEKAAERDRTIAERQGRASRVLDGPSMPITGAAREGASSQEPADQAEPSGRPEQR